MVDGIHVDGMLAQSLEVGLMKYTNEQNMVWIRCFDRKLFGEGMGIGHCSGTLIYTYVLGIRTLRKGTGKE